MENSITSIMDVIIQGLNYKHQLSKQNNYYLFVIDSEFGMTRLAFFSIYIAQNVKS